MTSHAKTSPLPLAGLCALLLLGCGGGGGGDGSGLGGFGGLGKPGRGAAMPLGPGAGEAPSQPTGEERPAPILGMPQGPVGGGASAGASHMFMPTVGPENTRGPKLTLDGRGDLHAVYPVFAGGDAYYAFCPDQCRDPAALEVVQLPAAATVLNAMLAVTSTGGPRVLLATGFDITWAECDADCGDPANWQSSVIVKHDFERELTGNTLALDAADRPRFVFHSYVALLGIGQKPPQTLYAQCDGACTDPSSWRVDAIADQIWQHSELRFDADGRAHLAGVAVTLENGGPTARTAAYALCEANCGDADAWTGVLLAPAYEDYAKQINPALGLALSAAGGPRIALLGESEAGGKQLLYFECDEDCTGESWRGALIQESERLGSGVDLALDENESPRIALTFAESIGIYGCRTAECTGEQSSWELAKVEMAAELPPDGIILWPNCTVSAWVLQDPSLALGPGGSALVGYQASDLSGGAQTLDPTKQRCLAGADMTLTRLARLPTY